MEGNSWILGFGPKHCLPKAFKSSRSIFEKSLEYGPGATLWPCLLRFMSSTSHLLSLLSANHLFAHFRSSLSCFMILEENFSLWSFSILRFLKNRYLPTLGVDEVGRRG